MLRHLLTIFCALLYLSSFGQENASDKDLAGVYRINFAPTEQVRISKENDKLMFELVGQGKGPLSRIAADQYEIRVKPRIAIEFIRDSSGKVQKFLWRRAPQKVD